MASKSLGTLTIDLVAKIGGFTSGMDKAARASGKSAKQIERELEAIRKKAADFGKVLGAAFVAVGTASTVAIKAAIDNADALDEMAQRTGIAVETLSRLQVAAKFGAVSMEDLQKSVGRLAVRQQEYAEGNEETVALFDALGVKAVDTSGKLRDAESVIVDLADAFASMPDNAQKTALAIDLLGKSGQNLIPFLNQGGDRIAELNRRADELGITLSAETAKAAGQFNDELDLAKMAVQGLATQVAADLLPDLVDLVNGMNEVSTAGSGVSSTAKDIANGIRTIADLAVRAKDVVRSLFLGTIGLFDGAAASAAQLFGASEDAAELIARSQAALSLSGQSFEAAFGDRAAAVNRPGGPVQFIDPPAPGKDAAEENSRNDRLAVYAKRRDTAASASKAQADADRAAAEAARELERADADLARRLEELAQQQAAFVGGLDDLQAQLDGPLAEAELAHKRRIEEVQKLLDDSAITVEEATRAQMLYADSMARTRDELDPLGKGYRDLLTDMQFEYDLLGKTNAQRVTELELRRLGIDLRTREGQAARDAVLAEVEAYEARERAISAMDDFRSSFEDNVASVLDGSKSIKDALRDMVDDLISQLARMVAQNFTESLFGQPGQAGGGSAGGWLSSLFGAFTKRATGGPVMSGAPYLVGEQGPELIIPSASGTVIPAGKTAAMLGGGATIVQNFNMPGRYDLRTQAQVAADAGRSTQRALARGTA